MQLIRTLLGLVVLAFFVLLIGRLVLDWIQAFAREFGIGDPTIAAPDLIPEDAGLRELKRRLTADVAARIAETGSSDWVARLTALGVPSGPVHARERVVRDAQILANGFLATVDQPGLGRTTMLGSTFDVGERSPLRPAPLPGADTAAVLAEVGFA